MPLTSFQSTVLKLLAANRSPESFVAGGIARNARESVRWSADVDVQLGVAPNRVDLMTAIDGVSFDEAGLRRKPRSSRLIALIAMQSWQA